LARISIFVRSEREIVSRYLACIGDLMAAQFVDNPRE